MLGQSLFLAPVHRKCRGLCSLKWFGDLNLGRRAVRCSSDVGFGAVHGRRRDDELTATDFLPVEHGDGIGRFAFLLKLHKPKTLGDVGVRLDRDGAFDHFACIGKQSPQLGLFHNKGQVSYAHSPRVELFCRRHIKKLQ